MVEILLLTLLGHGSTGNQSCILASDAGGHLTTGALVNQPQLGGL